MWWFRYKHIKLFTYNLEFFELETSISSPFFFLNEYGFFLKSLYIPFVFFYLTCYPTFLYILELTYLILSFTNFILYHLLLHYGYYIPYFKFICMVFINRIIKNPILYSYLKITYIPAPMVIIKFSLLMN